MHTDADDTHRSCCSSRGMHSGTHSTVTPMATVVRANSAAGPRRSGSSTWTMSVRMMCTVTPAANISAPSETSTAFAPTAPRQRAPHS